MKNLDHMKIEDVFKMFQKNYVGMKVVKKGKSSYVAIMLKVPKKGSGAVMNFVKKGMFHILPSIETAAPAIATFFVKIGFELIEDIMNIYAELKARKETDEETTTIIKDVLKKKYKNSNVVIKKLITYPIFESILVAIAMKSLPDVDPTGQTSKLATKIGATANTVNAQLLTSALICPECGKTENKKGVPFNAKTHKAHVASHRAHETRKRNAMTATSED